MSKLRTPFFSCFNLFKKRFDIYTDGSHKGKWGSWAYVVVKNDKVIHEASGRMRNTNSHRMEFQAAIEAISFLQPGATVCLHTDSRVLIECMQPPYKRPQINIDQVEKLDELIAVHNISWKWVKAHFGMIHNERCDQLCIQAREGNFN